MWTDLSFVRRQGLCLDTLYVQPFYSACSDSPGKISPCRRQTDRFSLSGQVSLQNWSKETIWQKVQVRRSTSTALSRPCRRWFPRSSASGSHGCWLWSSLDTYSTCNHEVQLRWPFWANKRSQSLVNVKKRWEQWKQRSEDQFANIINIIQII